MACGAEMGKGLWSDVSGFGAVRRTRLLLCDDLPGQRMRGLVRKTC